MKTIDAAAGKWPMILRAFGIHAQELDGKHHPCPCDGAGTDRFRFSDRGGSGSYFCRCSDGTKGGFALLQCKTGRDFADLAKEVDEMIGNTPDGSTKPDKMDPLPLLRSIQSRSKPAGDEVRAYLEARGLKTPPSVRQVDNLEYWEDKQVVGRYAAMAVRIVDAKGNPQSWHITYLQDAKKAPVTVPRKVLPPLTGIAGCAARLFPATKRLGLTEGIETAIAAEQLFDGYPVWSCISRGGLEKVEIPPDVEQVTIFGDNDLSFAGQAGAYRAAENLARKGFKVTVALPSIVGDWNDVLQELTP